MELRDVVGSLVALDDEQRAVTNELNRALDALSRAVLPEARFGVDAGRLRSLEERVGFGSDVGSELDELTARLELGVVERAEELRDGAAEEDFRSSLTSRLDELCLALEAVTRLKQLLRQRAEVAARLDGLKGALDGDELTLELLDVVLASREAAADQGAAMSQTFLDEARTVAREDGALAGTAANVRALREALASGVDPSAVAEDLSRRVVDVAVHAGQEREELARRLAALGRDAERQQELSAGLFQAVTKATEVLELASGLHGRLDQHEDLPPGMLGPLKAACIEHGAITLLLDLRRHRLERSDLDAATQELSGSLGDLFAALAHRPEPLQRLSRVWEDLAAVDAGAIEQAWEDAYAEALGVEREGGGVLSLSQEELTALAGADSLDPWSERLVTGLEARRSAVAALAQRLRGDDVLLSELAAEAGPVGEAAVRVKERLAHFLAEMTRAVRRYHDRVAEDLEDPESGFARIPRQVAGFAWVERLPPEASPEERRAATGKTLEAIQELFVVLESRLPAGSDAADWKGAEEEARRQVAASHRGLAAALARLQRLRALLFPPLNPACHDALELARQVRGREAPEERERLEAGVEELGEALEALYLEKLYLEGLRLPPGSEVRTVAALVRERNRRLLDLHGASLVLLFRLLTLLGAQYEDLGGDERLSHLSWMEELLLHCGAELDGYLLHLDEALFELGDNAERVDRYLLAFDSYHRWAAAVAETEAGHDLLSARGRPLYERFELRLARLGAAHLDRTAEAEADWRVSSAVETLIELYRLLELELSIRPTLTRVEETLVELRERAESVKQRMADDADQEAQPQGGQHLFG